MNLQNQEVRSKASRRLLIAGGILLFILLLVVILSIVFTDDLVDIFWYHSLGYELYFWQRKLYRYIVFIAVSFSFFLVFFLNFWIGSRFLKRSSKKVEDAPRETYRKIYKAFQTGSLMFYVPLSLALSIPIAMPL
jgi:hypothetical protein